MKRLSTGIAAALALAMTTSASAQGRGVRHSASSASGSSAARYPLPSALPAPTSLRGRFGADAAARLMRSPDPDERLRGVERAAASGTVEGLALLERAGRASGPGALDPRLPDEGVARKDPRALLATVRGLAAWPEDEGARAVLEEIVRASVEAFATRVAGVTSHDPAADEVNGAERTTLAREEAAIALAASENPSALEHLVTAARSGGPGQDAALVALGVLPPSEPVALGGVALTTPPTIALAGRIGDLRTLDAILGAVQASDPALRAAAIAALGTAGDTRAIEVARASLHDEDARVRAASGEALGRLSAPDAPAAVEALIADDATVLDGLRVAETVQGDGVTKAAAARAAASADPTIRAAAVAALGQQVSPLAVQALVALVAMPLVEGDAASALARSPSPGALGAIETLATPASSLRRVAARAYFVRRFVRGERSARLDATLAGLAASADPLDRAVATQALVAFGERSLGAALSDRDARVRRAAAMGALARPEAMTEAAVLARAAAEPDEATRVVLARAWAEDGGDSLTPSSVLGDRVDAGNGDAPLAAFALARRSLGADGARVDALLGSTDPLLRAVTARGLGASVAADATGRLTAAYTWEADPRVRRAILAALAARPNGPDAQMDRSVFALAARLDPDAVARWTASRALAGATDPGRASGSSDREVAWLHAMPAEGAAPVLGLTGSLATSDGRVIPLVFDDEGYALVPGVSPGDARVRLAPRLPAYSPSSP